MSPQKITSQQAMVTSILSPFSSLREIGHLLFPKSVPLRFETEAEFVNILQHRILQGHPVSIEVIGGYLKRNTTNNSTVGAIATFDYLVTCSAMIGRAEVIQCERRLFERFGSERGMSDSESRDRATVTIALAADLQGERLREFLPSSTVSVKCPKGPLTGELREQLYYHVRSLGLDVSQVSALLRE